MGSVQRFVGLIIPLCLFVLKLFQEIYLITDGRIWLEDEEFKLYGSICAYFLIFYFFYNVIFNS